LINRLAHALLHTLMLFSPPSLPSPTNTRLSFFSSSAPPRHLHSFPTRRSSDLSRAARVAAQSRHRHRLGDRGDRGVLRPASCVRSEEHTSELQSQSNLVCRLLLEKKNQNVDARPLGGSGLGRAVLSCLTDV